MRNIKFQYSSTDFISAFFILLFVHTALSKLLAIESFFAILSQFPVIVVSPRLFGYTILFTELMIAALLFIPKTRIGGLLLSGFLMSLFTLYLGILLLTKTSLPCSCGGIIASMDWKTHLLFNALCVMIAQWSWRAAKRTSKLRQCESTFYSNKQAVPKTCTTE